MKKSTIITIACFVLGIIVLSAGFILLTDNNISNSIFTTTTTTTTGGGEPEGPKYDPMNFFEYDVTQFVTLGQYTGFEVEVESLGISEEELEWQIAMMLFNDKAFTKLEEGTVGERVIFNFDYSGYRKLYNENGDEVKVKFEGGTATGHDAYIEDGLFYDLTTSSLFIQGFAEGILGGKVGEAFVITATFPEDYENGPDLAGQTVYFDIKINYIAKTELTDEWVKEDTEGQYTTAADYRTYLKEYVNSSIESSNRVAVWLEVVKNATFIEIPKQEFDYIYDYYYTNIDYYAQMFGTTAEKFVEDGYAKMYLGINATTMDELSELVRDIIREELVVFAVMQAENMSVSDEEFDALVDELVASSGKTREEVIENYTEKYLREQILFDKADKFISANNTLVLKGESAQ